MMCRMCWTTGRCVTFALPVVIYLWKHVDQSGVGLASPAVMLQTLPVVEVITVGHDESCPADFTFYNITAELENFDRMSFQSFPGVASGHCVCPDGRSSLDKCDSSKCVRVPAVASTNFKTWRGAKMC